MAISPAGVPAQTSLLSAAGTVPLSILLCRASSPSSREVFKELHLFCHSNASRNVKIDSFGEVCFLSSQMIKRIVTNCKLCIKNVYMNLN